MFYEQFYNISIGVNNMYIIMLYKFSEYNNNYINIKKPTIKIFFLSKKKKYNRPQPTWIML